jgi:hypothetical protein
MTQQLEADETREQTNKNREPDQAQIVLSRKTTHNAIHQPQVLPSPELLIRPLPLQWPECHRPLRRLLMGDQLSRSQCDECAGICSHVATSHELKPQRAGADAFVESLIDRHEASPAAPSK